MYLLIWYCTVNIKTKSWGYSSLWYCYIVTFESVVQSKVLGTGLFGQNCVLAEALGFSSSHPDELCNLQSGADGKTGIV
jgi:hypothetical protein